MDILFIIYIFALFVIFSPNFIFQYSKSNNILVYVLHAIIFSIVLYVTYNSVSKKQTEGATIGTYNKNNDKSSLNVNELTLGGVLDEPPEIDKQTDIQYSNEVVVSSPNAAEEDKLTAMPPYDYSNFRTYDYENMEKKLKMLESHKHTNHYFDLVPNFNENKHEILCAADYGTSKPCCRQPNAFIPELHQCDALKPYCTDYISGKQWGKCVSTNPHPKPNLVYDEVIHTPSAPSPAPQVVVQKEYITKYINNCPGSAPTSKNTLTNTNQTLLQNEYLVSSNKEYFAIMQDDGNFVIYKGSGPNNNKGVVWDTSTVGEESFAIMQSDGNFVIYKGSGPDNNKGDVWATMTQTKGVKIVLEDSGVLNVYNSNNTIVWSSQQAPAPAPAPPAQPAPPQCISSSFMVAVGGGINSIAWSEDGKSWNGLGSSIFSASGLGVAWNGSLWVAVGVGTNTIAWSEDGKNWTGLGSSIFSDSGRGIACNGSMWVAVGVGNNNSVAWSEDGKNWTGVGTGISSMMSVAWNGSMWVAVGIQGNSTAIIWSEDGKTWNNIYGGVSLRTQAILSSGTSVAWNGSIWLAGGNSLAWSNDGKNWNQVNNVTNIFGKSPNIYGLTWNGSMWLASGYYITNVGIVHNKLAHSTDGKNWTSVSNSQYGGNVAWNGSVWVILGTQGWSGGINTMGWSSDGETWTGLGKTVFSAGGYGIASKNVLPYTDKWANCQKNASASKPEIYQTVNINVYQNPWKQPMISSIEIYQQPTNSPKSSLTKEGDTVVYTYSSNMDKTTDMFILKNSSNGKLTQYNVNIKCTPSTFTVAVGNGTNTIAWSDDGRTWKGLGNVIFEKGYGVAWNGKMWVAVGSASGSGNTDNTIAYSEDGKQWWGGGTSVFSGAGRGVAWNGSMWVAVGNGQNSIAYSEDGKDWTGLGQSIFPNGGGGVACNGSMWVAVGYGSNSIAYSEDGKTWSKVNQPSIFGYQGITVAWNGKIWVAGGQQYTYPTPNTLAYSDDGKNWTAVSNSINLFGSICTGLAWNGNMWLATGYSSGNASNKIARSQDGKEWTIINNTVNNGGSGMAWNGSLWITGGNNNNILSYSEDGEKWSELGSTPFSINCAASASKNVLPYTYDWANCQ